MVGVGDVVEHEVELVDRAAGGGVGPGGGLLDVVALATVDRIEDRPADAAALREAREETVVEGDSRRYGWLAWVAALVIVGSGLAIWLG